MKNRLYFGDCLDVLKELHKEHPKGFIDLIYIDPRPGGRVRGLASKLLTLSHVATSWAGGVNVA